MTALAPDELSPAELMPLFSNVAIPYTGYRIRGTCRWFGGDSEQHYLSNTHSLLGPESVDYSFNKHGYRCIEFDERERFDKNHLHLLTVGESHSLGLGVPENRVYGHLVAQKLQAYTGRPVHHWNLSQPGASPEFIARVLPSALAVLRPDFVILYFPNRHRREYIFEDGNYLTCGEGDVVAGSTYTADRHDAVKDAHSQHAHYDSNTFGLWKLFIVCQRHLKAHKVSTWAAQASFGVPLRLDQYIDMDKIEPRKIMHVGTEKYADKPELMYARDGKHAGIGPHADLADDIYEIFVKEYAQELKQLVAHRVHRTG